jgi:lipoate-protein ligase B
MRINYLGKVSFSEALAVQSRAVSEPGGEILGFETSEPVVTLGVRARPDRDIIGAGFAIQAVDRGGQATLHNPGQLVIFPVIQVRAFGARRWIEMLAAVSKDCIREWGIEAVWDETRPGLYTERGKLMSLGVRISRGISTHGLAINVCNNLDDFRAIRVCGAASAAMDRMGEGVRPEHVFPVWVQKFQRHIALAGTAQG